MNNLIERIVERLETDREELWRNLIEAGFDIEGVVSAVIDALAQEASELNGFASRSTCPLTSGHIHDRVKR